MNLTDLDKLCPVTNKLLSESMYHPASLGLNELKIRKWHKLVPWILIIILPSNASKGNADFFGPVSNEYNQ